MPDLCSQSSSAFPSEICQPPATACKISHSLVPLLPSCPCTALPSFSLPLALFYPRAFALFLPLPRTWVPGHFHGSPSICHPVPHSTVSLERPFCSPYMNGSFLPPSFSSILFFFITVATSDISCIYLLLPAPPLNAVSLAQDLALLLVPRLGLAHFC